MESNCPDQVSCKEEKLNRTVKRFLLIVNVAMLTLGNVGGPLIMRLYFLKGGKSVWLSSFLQTCGWPFLVFPLFVSYVHRRKLDGVKLFFIRTRLFLACVVIGLLTGLDNFLSAYGVSLLPVSTSALIIATQLAFTAGFAFFLVKQRFTPFSVNAIFLLSLGAGVLALHTSTDRPGHETKKQYFFGFFMTLATSVLYGFILPSIELTYKKARQNITYSLVMEMQMVISFFATVFCTIGMLARNEYQKIPQEARTFELGKTRYYVVLAFSALLWQCFFMGATGTVFSGSSLLSGIVIATLLPVTETLAVLFYHEKFPAEKGISLALSIWGFGSYFYGEKQVAKKKTQDVEPDVVSISL